MHTLQKLCPLAAIFGEKPVYFSHSLCGIGIAPKWGNSHIEGTNQI